MESKIFRFEGRSGQWAYEQESGVENPQYQQIWVSNVLNGIAREQPPSSTLLDVGAGEGRFKGLIEKLGFQYRGHDFAGYLHGNLSFGS